MQGALMIPKTSLLFMAKATEMVTSGLLENFENYLKKNSCEKQMYFYLCTKFIVPSIGSIIHVGFSENDETNPDPSEMSSSPMNS